MNSMKITTILKFVFNIEKIEFLIPFLLLIIYGPGLIIAYFRIGLISEVCEFFLLMSLSLFTYFIVYRILKKIIRKKLAVVSGFSIIDMSKFFFILYFIFILYVTLTAPAIPLIQSFMGASSSDLSNYRELFLKARTGLEGLLVYINAIFTVAILPFITASLYVVRYKYRHVYLLFFVFTLFLSMEKSLIARALLPLLVLLFNGYVKDKYVTLKRILLFAVMGLFLVTFLSLGNLTKDETILISELVESDPNAARYYIVSNPDNVFMFLFNRIFWIPYMTAIDWLSFFNVVLHRELVMGASSSLFSFLFGVERINLERLVFEFEWGQNESGTGSANTVYFVDIFLNFGWIGVILANALLACIVRFFVFCDNYVAKASFYVYAYFLVTSTIIGVLFSSGLLVLMTLILFTKNNYAK